MKSFALAVALIAACVVSRCAVCIADHENSALDTLKSLEGTWVSDKPGQDGQPFTIVFHTTSAGSVVMETMFPGSDHEMVNTYHRNGDDVMMTHYCAQGVQPRLK